jgi:hemoglobin
LLGCGHSKPAPKTVATAPSDATPAPAPAPGSSAPAPAPAPPAANKSLYERLGGLPAIQAVVGEFVANVAGDNRINQRFFNTDIENLKKLLTEFVCMATGGPCKYTGRDMATTHAGMDLVDEEFGALVENLVKALDKFKVPDKEKGELLGALGPLKPQIVVAADKLHPIPDAKLAPAVKLAAGLKDKAGQDLLNAAITAGKRGQLSYAEQLFSRAEMQVGVKNVASIAAVFRAGAPTRITTPTKKLEDKGPQAKVVGGSEADEPDAKPAKGSLTGMLTINGKAPDGLGVVMLFPKSGGGKKRTPKARVIEQRNKEFAPHVMAVPVGSTISFPNFDPIYHNVFSLSKPKSFDLGLYKSGETREVKVDKPGIIRLGCNLHAAMSAYLVVVDAPNYVIPGADGKFEFKSLAPGKYKLQAWNERSGEPTTAEIEVKDGANTTSLDLKGGNAGLGADKFGNARQ